jgi:hypothetical protein
VKGAEGSGGGAIETVTPGPSLLAGGSANESIDDLRSPFVTASSPLCGFSCHVTTAIPKPTKIAGQRSWPFRPESAGVGLMGERFPPRQRLVDLREMLGVRIVSNP